MKRCVKKRLAMFLAAATLVTSAGLSSGLTSLAETVTKNAEVSAKSTVRVATAPVATDNEPTSPSITPGAGEQKVDIEDDVKEQGVTTVIADKSLKDLTIKVADEVSEEEVKTQAAFVNWLKDTVIKTVSTILKGVDLDTVDHESVKQFDISANGAGSIKMEFEKD